MGKTLAPAAHPAPARVSFLIVPRFNMATVITMIEVMRQLARQFKQNIGCTVVQFGLLLRLQHARVLLIATRLSVPLPPTTSTKGSRQGGLNGWPITVRCGVAQAR